MSDVKWIKIVTNIFDDEKILLIESLPEADSIIVIWFKLLCMAGKQNNSGVFMLNDRVPYTDEMLSTIFRRPLNTVRLALKTFENYGMVEIIDGALTIPNWEKHQSLDALEQKKAKNRERVAAYRARQKLIAAGDECNGYSNDTVTHCNAVEGDKEEDKNKKEKERRIDYQLIADMYNETCVSLPRLTVLSEKRKKAIKARLNTYTLEQFRAVFQKAEASAFLKGANSRNWSANFDWLMQDANFAKVLDGNYDSSASAKSGSVGRNGIAVGTTPSDLDGIF